MATRSSSVNRSRNTSSTTTTGGLNISRAQEKEQLETLNNRLAVYIDTVRRLEQDNQELKVILKFRKYLKNIVLIKRILYYYYFFTEYCRII